jgi:hypothetical protein
VLIGCWSHLELARAEQQLGPGSNAPHLFIPAVGHSFTPELFAAHCASSPHDRDKLLRWSDVIPYRHMGIPAIFICVKRTKTRNQVNAKSLCTSAACTCNEAPDLLCPFHSLLQWHARTPATHPHDPVVMLPSGQPLPRQHKRDSSWCILPDPAAHDLVLHLQTAAACAPGHYEFGPRSHASIATLPSPTDASLSRLASSLWPRVILGCRPQISTQTRRLVGTLGLERSGSHSRRSTGLQKLASTPQPAQTDQQNISLPVQCPGSHA